MQRGHRRDQLLAYLSSLFVLTIWLVGSHTVASPNKVALHLASLEVSGQVATAQYMAYAKPFDSLLPPV